MIHLNKSGHWNGKAKDVWFNMRSYRGVEKADESTFALILILDYNM